MIRIVLTVILPFLLPTLLYALWLAASRRAAPGGPMAASAMPWLWLVAAGLALTALALVLANPRLGVPQGTYVPPHWVGGRVVPGEVVPPGDEKRPP